MSADMSRCAENERLLHAFGEAVQEVVMFQDQHFAAVVAGDSDAERYELLIHLAGEKRQAAKYAYLSHIEAHGCEKVAEEALVDQVAIRNRRIANRPERRKRSDPENGFRRRISDLA